MDIDIGGENLHNSWLQEGQHSKKMAEVVFVEAIPTWHLEVAGENVLWLLY